MDLPQIYNTIRHYHHPKKEITPFSEHYLHSVLSIWTTISIQPPTSILFDRSPHPHYFLISQHTRPSVLFPLNQNSNQPTSATQTYNTYPPLLFLSLSPELGNHEGIRPLPHNRNTKSISQYRGGHWAIVKWHSMWQNGNLWNQNLPLLVPIFGLV